MITYILHNNWDSNTGLAYFVIMIYIFRREINFISSSANQEYETKNMLLIRFKFNVFDRQQSEV